MLWLGRIRPMTSAGSIKDQPAKRSLSQLPETIGLVNDWPLLN